MSIAQLRAISERDLPLIVDELDEVLGVRSLIEGGVIVGHGGTLVVLPNGDVVVSSPALIKEVTAMGRQFIGPPHSMIDALGDFF